MLRWHCRASLIRATRYNRPMGSNFVRVVALLLAFCVPVYGFAAVSKACNGAMQDAAAVAMTTATQTGFDTAHKPDYPMPALDVATHSGSCVGPDGGQQCQLGIPPSLPALDHAGLPALPPLYTKTVTQAFLELAERPPMS